MKNGIVYCDPIKELLVVPSVMETEVIKLAHDQNHFACKKTQELIKKNYYIPNLTKKVAKVVNGCVECIMVDAKRGKKEGFLSPIDKACEPLGTYHIDPLTINRNTQEIQPHPSDSGRVFEIHVVIPDKVDGGGGGD